MDPSPDETLNASAHSSEPAEPRIRPATRVTISFSIAYGGVLLALLVIGFGRTFFFAPFFSPEPETLVVYAHGLTLTAWFVLFMVQSLLVPSGRVALHRKLGLSAAALVTIASLVFAVMAVQLFQKPAPIGVDTSEHDLARRIRLVRDLCVFSAFPTLVLLGLRFRRRREAHRRLMLLATISLTGPAISRLPMLPGLEQLPRVPTTLAVMVLVVFCPLLYEWIRRGRVHPALAWGAPLYYLWMAGTGALVPLLMHR